MPFVSARSAFRPFSELIRTVAVKARHAVICFSKQMVLVSRCSNRAAWKFRSKRSKGARFAMRPRIPRPANCAREITRIGRAQKGGRLMSCQLIKWSSFKYAFSSFLARAQGSLRSVSVTRTSESPSDCIFRLYDKNNRALSHSRVTWLPTGAPRAASNRFHYY